MEGQAAIDDPLLGTARLIVASGVLSLDQVAGRYEAIRAQVRELADKTVTHRQLSTRAEVIAPLAPRQPERVAWQRFWADVDALLTKAAGP